ncbi:uncharacterized protein LOC129781715 [Toxorhynchites rutilus septentrionalis]|uniref:uncharacterized protein LOC129781715 n=1 Tax=Toxorhynchites rutilus septentrionalis TaxID=329112 RepID=UPI0024792856|nr:uncharacterized protein LOC129781715 [Toxorhynchites rutilus septentrionalis]
MAANTGVKIFRDFLRESPCRMAYAMTHRQNYAKQYSKNHSLRKISSKSHQARPKTAPMMVSNLAQAITTNKLMEVSSRKRPTTTISGKKPVPRRQENEPQRTRAPCEEIRKIPSGPSSSDDVRRKQQPPQKLKPKHPAAKSSSRPCKICKSPDDCPIPEQWQKIFKINERNPPSSDGFRHLIDEIERIRSQLIVRDDMKQIRFNESLKLINEIKQQIDSVTKKSSSFHASFICSKF